MDYPSSITYLAHGLGELSACRDAAEEVGKTF